MGKYLGEEYKKLGFGFMRLPMNGDTIDMEHTCKMVDEYMAKGFTYFDTAYVYIGGKSEVAIKDAVVDRYPRDSFQVASKLPIWSLENLDDMERIFQESLDRAGLEYYDFYLLHALNKNSAQKCDDLGCWDFIAKKKAEGKIKHIGFSFHDSADVLDDILTKHPESEFVQLQINYIDWESENVQSKKCYETAIKHNKPIIIMEPVKGGTLAGLPQDAVNLLKSKEPNLSVPSWAIRYAASFDNVVTVLSGMSNMEQLNDNISYMENFKALTSDEQKTIDEVVEIINRVPLIPCTDCKYCVEGCPQQINIPAYFSAMNHHKKFDTDQTVASNMNRFNEIAKDGGKPSECIACGLCENYCPQKIEIINELANIAGVYEK